jgi:ribonuclease HI
VVLNNAAEYEALIIGLEIALSMGISTLHAYGDSQLIVNQLLGVYTIKNKVLYHILEKQKRLYPCLLI